jgi:hypothetical protein
MRPQEELDYVERLLKGLLRIEIAEWRSPEWRVEIARSLSSRYSPLAIRHL